MEKSKKTKNVEKIVKAISGETDEKVNYMIAWLDGWECHKNASVIKSKPKETKSESSV